MRPRRRLAGLVCDLLAASLPASNRDWARAARAEVAAIDDDAEALAFALETLWGLGLAGVRCLLLQLAVWVGGGEREIQTLVRLGGLDRAQLWPRALGVLSAIGAGAVGLAYLAAAGAPGRYLAINVAALLVGLAALAIVGRLRSTKRARSESVMLWLGLTLFGVAAYGVGLDGATRWLRLGGLPVQPSLVILPMMIVGFARSR
ncbi:FtsW/RodA/SpoVE family cell cycle protein, partial [Caulobacter sp. SSI4214]|uniref:FtsW/RodA/SpoVE family cell cycle protein n=1 Tax=Caulobacter sp. SSI4214 TaxID=2575739 RepID=UPI00143CAFBF